MAIVLPHGVFIPWRRRRSHSSKKLLEDGSIYAVIGMLANLFFGTSIPTTVIVLKKEPPKIEMYYSLTLVENLSKEKNQNKLSEEKHSKKSSKTTLKEKDVEKYAHLATFDEIKEK